MASSFTVGVWDSEKKWHVIDFPAPFTGAHFVQLQVAVNARHGAMSTEMFWEDDQGSVRAIDSSKSLEEAIQHSLIKAEKRCKDPWLSIYTKHNPPPALLGFNLCNEATRTDQPPSLQHYGITCDGCGLFDFAGHRYKCLRCFDLDLCHECYATRDRLEMDDQVHTRDHLMKRIEIVQNDAYSNCSAYSTCAVIVVACVYCDRKGMSTAECYEHVKNDHKNLMHANKEKEVDFSHEELYAVVENSPKPAHAKSDDLKNPAFCHQGVECDGCGLLNFPGLRFKCKRCFDFDLCEECYKVDRFDLDRDQTHVREHPMKRIELLDSNDSSDPIYRSYRTVAACDYCKENGFLPSEYSEHLRKYHKEPERGNADNEVDASFKKMLTELWNDLNQRDSVLAGREKAVYEREKAVYERERLVRAREDVVAMEKTHTLAIYEKTTKTEIALKCWQSDLEELEASAKYREKEVAEREAAVAEKEARWNVEEAMDKATLLPSRWNHGLSPVSDLHFSYPLGRGGWLGAIEGRREWIEPMAVRADRPCPLDASIYYFEVRVIRSDGFMGIGITKESVSLDRLPGWDAESYGFHGDDGMTRSQPVKGVYTRGVEYGPTYSTGDVVGCGLNVKEKTVFFTKNGVNLGTAFTITEPLDGFYPTVGLRMRGAMVEANFGQRPFVYDIGKDIEAAEKASAEMSAEVTEKDEEDEIALAKEDEDKEEDEKDENEEGDEKKDSNKEEEHEFAKDDEDVNEDMSDLYADLGKGKHPLTAMKHILAVKYLQASRMNKADIHLCVAVINKRNEEFYPDSVKRLIKDLELVMERTGVTRSEAIRALLEGKYEVDKQGRVLERNASNPNKYCVVEGIKQTADENDAAPSEVVAIVNESDVNQVMEITRCDRDWAIRALLRNDGEKWLAAKEIAGVQEAREAAAKDFMIPPPILDDDIGIMDDEDDEGRSMGDAKKKIDEMEYDSDASYENIDLEYGQGTENI